jgi:hypothetical protein
VIAEIHGLANGRAAGRAPMDESEAATWGNFCYWPFAEKVLLFVLSLASLKTNTIRFRR